MKKSIPLSIALHLTLLFLLAHGGGDGEGNGKGNPGGSQGTEDKGHFLGQPVDSPIDVVSIPKQKLNKLALEREKKIKKFKTDCGTDAYGGIGVTGPGGDNDTKTAMLVSEVGPGTPAEMAGIKPNDLLLGDEVLRGKPGTSVNVEVSSLNGTPKRTVTIIRQLICFSKDKKIITLPNE
jgi:hypothetical protein